MATRQFLLPITPTAFAMLCETFAAADPKQLNLDLEDWGNLGVQLAQTAADITSRLSVEDDAEDQQCQRLLKSLDALPDKMRHFEETRREEPSNFTEDGAAELSTEQSVDEQPSNG